MGWDEGVDATNGIHIMAKICLSESYCINVLILSISAKGMFAQFRFSQMEGAVEVERPLVRSSLKALYLTVSLSKTLCPYISVLVKPRKTY